MVIDIPFMVDWKNSANSACLTWRYELFSC